MIHKKYYMKNEFYLLIKEINQNMMFIYSKEYYPKTGR
ncbi:hypothetical protein mru_1395 [Methanobrevibacter ruminantium M1]|uniref:Uncharacterized protein n=1 Tax=Methanobrevibacter ruminantium (strain ATCC 35063 / DSM 1093 / JCM 13430 / OCM 146 / M1) TaxID=634498 RepID=D3E3Y4_METRM|nr:hypothetical protein mru_1395 [Methanobrevibacter ruminantium M1]